MNDRDEKKFSEWLKNSWANVDSRDYPNLLSREAWHAACEYKQKELDKQEKYIIQLAKENEALKEQLNKAESVIDYYSKPFVNGGCYIGNVDISRCHGSDCEVIGAFSIGGYKAREYFKNKGER
jgi:hypothetical protein